MNYSNPIQIGDSALTLSRSSLKNSESAHRLYRLLNPVVQVKQISVWYRKTKYHPEFLTVEIRVKRSLIISLRVYLERAKVFFIDTHWHIKQEKSPDFLINYICTKTSSFPSVSNVLKAIHFRTSAICFPPAYNIQLHNFSCPYCWPAPGFRGERTHMYRNELFHVKAMLTWR